MDIDGVIDKILILLSERIKKLPYQVPACIINLYSTLSLIIFYPFISIP